jgi:hypothetical protein
MVDTRQAVRVKRPGGARGGPVVADTIGEERSPSWPRAPHWKCGIPCKAVSRVRIPLAPHSSYSIRDLPSGYAAPRRTCRAIRAESRSKDVAGFRCVGPAISAAARFSTLSENALVSRVNRRIPMRTVRFCRSTLVDCGARGVGRSSSVHRSTSGSDGLRGRRGSVSAIEIASDSDS